MRKCFFGVLFYFFAYSSALSQQALSQVKTYIIDKIEVRGLISMDEKRVLERIPLVEGQLIKIPGKSVTDAIKSLWKQKLFKNLRVERISTSENAIKLIFHVEENPVVIDVQYQGVVGVSIDEIIKQGSFYNGMLFSKEKIAIGIQAIKRYYEEEGFYNVSVDYQILDRNPGQVVLKLVIKENQQAYIEKILFYGNNAFEDGELEWHLGETVANNWWRHIFGKPRLKRYQFEEDKKKLSDFYQENGYRDMRIVRDSISYTEDKEMIFLHIWVDEGPKYIIRNVEWEGNTLYPSDYLTRVFGFQKGDVYNKKLIDEKSIHSQKDLDISSLYLDRGYMAFRPDISEVVVEGDSIDLKIFITEGELFRIRKVEFSGNSRTKDHVLRRSMYISPGDVFNREKIIRSIREVAQLGFFDAEKIIPDVRPVGESNEVDVIFKVFEKSSDTFNASIGYGPSTGVIGSVGFTFKNFSASDFFRWKGFYGDGQQIDLKADFGSRARYRRFSASFKEPWAFNVPLSIGGSLYYYFYLTNFANQTGYEVFGASITAGRRLTWPDNYFSASLTVRYQINLGNLYNFDRALNITFADEFSLIGVLSRNSSDNPIYPRNGSEFSLTGQISGGPFLPGVVSLWKITTEAKLFKKVIGNLVFVIGGEFGHLGRFTDGDIVPYVDYFYMGGGGISSVKTIPLKGYSDGTVGPYNPKFQNVSGRAYLKLLTELRHPIILNESISAYMLTFFEFGNVWEDIDRSNFLDLKKSFGVGLRIYLPILGLLGLDYAYGFDDITSNNTGNGKAWRFVFTFGPFAR